MDAFWTFVWSQLTPTALVAILVFVIGTWLRATIEKGEQHEFDKKLEQLRTEMRRDEESWKAALKARDDQLATIRSGVLSNLSSRHAELDKRRLDAAERLWKATVGQKKFGLALEFTKYIKIDVALAEAGKNTAEGKSIQQLGEFFWKSIGLDKFKAPDELPDVDRLYLPADVWTLFSVHRQIYGLAMVQIAALRSGVNGDALKKRDGLQKLVIEVLPHQKPFVEKYGDGAFPYLADELEDKIIATLTKLIGDRDLDTAQLAAAVKLSRSAAALTEASIATQLEAAKVDIPAAIQAAPIDATKEQR